MIDGLYTGSAVTTTESLEAWADSFAKIGWSRLLFISMLLRVPTTSILASRSHPGMLMDESDANPYLQQEVMSASPARLRWMLIKRSAELCSMVEQLWGAGQTALANQWLLRIREILGELLDGVKDAQNPLSTPITDFYLFLLQLAFEVEQRQDRQRLQVLAELLAIEAETWRLVVENMGTETAAATSPASKSLFPSFNNALDPLASGFSLEV